LRQILLVGGYLLAAHEQKCGTRFPVPIDSHMHRDIYLAHLKRVSYSWSLKKWDRHTGLLQGAQIVRPMKHVEKWRRNEQNIPVILYGVVDLRWPCKHSAGMVNLFKKTMLSTGQAFCKKPWYLSK
jgi:hypothetical protein